MLLRKPYLLFLGDAADQLAAKTAVGVAHWCPDDCVGQLRLPNCNADLGLADLTIEEAAAKGAQTLLIGVANRGGRFSDQWLSELYKALDAGMDIASGLHNRLTDLDELVQRAQQKQRRLFDVRHPAEEPSIGDGKPRTGQRLLTVGTDCSVGKMYTSLAIAQELTARKIKSTFRATGQTGIFIAGSGISVDAVVADFISGSIETLCPNNDADHWDIIEGQGSLFHASYAGVSMGLLHGAQADALILCHEPTRTHMRGLPHYPLPELTTCLAANEAAARLTNPKARCIGLSINTSALDEQAARQFLDDTSQRLNLPCVDPVRDGVGPLVDVLISC